MAERIIIAELDLNTQALIKSSMETRQSLSALKKEQSELKKSGEEGSAQFIRNAAEIQRLTPIVNAQTKAITSQVSETGKLTSATNALTDAVERENLTEQEYLDNNKKLYALRKELVKTDVDYQKNLDALNEKINENNAYLQENGSAMDKLKMNIGNYRADIVGAFEDLNVFNGGLLGFVSRAQAAGGVMPLLSTSLKAITSGIWGATKASLAFIATPIGAVIAAIGLVIGLLVNYLKSTQEGIDKVTSVTRPLQAIFSALLGLFQKVGKALFDTFSNPKKAMMDLYEFVKQNLINRFTAFGEILDGIMNLDFKKVADGVLQAGTGVQGMTDKIANAAKATGDFLSDAAKKGQEIDRLQKEIEKGQLAFNRNQIAYNDAIDEQLKISKDTSKSFKEREAAAREIIRVNQQMGDEEAAIIQKKIEKLKIEQSLKEVTREQQQELIDLEVELDAAQDKGLEAQLEQMRVISGARKEAAQKAAEQQQKILDDAASKLKIQYDIFQQLEGDKIKAVDEQIAYSEKARQKEIAIAQAEYNRSKKTENDKLSLTKATNDANLKFIEAQTNALVENADKELQLIIVNNRSKLDSSKFLTQEMVAEEKLRLQAISDAERDNAKVKLDAGILSQEAYNAEINRINDENYKNNQVLTLEREQAERDRKLIDLENKRAQDQLTFDEQLAIDLERMSIQRDAELAAAEKSGADKALILKKYADIEKGINKDVEESKLAIKEKMLSQAKGLFKEHTLAYKIMAIGEATINTYLAATKALAEYAYPVGGIFAGLAIAQGLVTVSKIAGVKLEKGGLVEVGGNRHSNGGTKFVGEDGTQFEAEKGELIGVMNRNAASHFMNFNNSYPSGAGRASNYFASGGIVSREIAPASLNVDELAMKIVEANQQVPPPVVYVQDIASQNAKIVNVKADRAA